MNFNMNDYHKEIDISKEKQNIINEYINKYSEEIYEKDLPEIISAEEMYYLTTVSQNLLNWYPFSKEDSVLEIGGDLGQLTGLFSKKCKDVTTIEPQWECAEAIRKRYKDRENIDLIAGKLEDISLNKKYDIITVIGNINRIEEIIGKQLDLENTIRYLEKYLNENGKMLIAVDNKFGLRYWAGNPENMLNKKFISLIGYHSEPISYETFTKKSLEEILQKMEYNFNFYYPLPDYKMPNVIFTDEGLPKYNSIDKYNPYTAKNSDLIINEIDVFREILTTNPEMFTFFTNSFLIEISKEKRELPYNYISFNNMRKEKYRLITKIGKDYVEKEAVTEEANQHIEQISKNIEYLKENQIKTLDETEENKIKSKYVEQKNLLNEVLTENLRQGKKDEFDKLVQKYIDLFLSQSYKTNNYDETIFKKYNIEIEDKELIKSMNFLKNGLWDMTFKNCFYIDDQFYFFDQEWNDENIPLEFILYRSILYTISLRRYINIDELMEQYGLTQYREIFEKLDNVLQEEIRDDKIWKFYNQNKYFDVDGTKQELINLSQRDHAKELAIENLQKDNDYLINIREQLTKEKEQLSKALEDMEQKYNQLFSVRVGNKIRKFFRK